MLRDFKEIFPSSHCLCRQQITTINRNTQAKHCPSKISFRSHVRWKCLEFRTHFPIYFLFKWKRSFQKREKMYKKHENRLSSNRPTCFELVSLFINYSMFSMYLEIFTISSTRNFHPHERIFFFTFPAQKWGKDSFFSLQRLTRVF